jgi:hypothetical protein
MRGKYDPTVNPPDQRTRSQKQTIVNPNNGIPSIEICEERIILAEDENAVVSEQTLKELPAFSVNILPEMMPIEIPEIGLDYQPTGRMITIAQAFSGYAAFVQWCHKMRDNQLATQTPHVIESGE